MVESWEHSRFPWDTQESSALLSQARHVFCRPPMSERARHNLFPTAVVEPPPSVPPAPYWVCWSLCFRPCLPGLVRGPPGCPALGGGWPANSLPSGLHPSGFVSDGGPWPPTLQVADLCSVLPWRQPLSHGPSCRELELLTHVRRMYSFRLKASRPVSVI